MDTRVGLPNEHLAGNNSIEISNPTFATAVGLVMNSMKNRKNLNMNQKTLTDSNKDNIENDEEINSEVNQNDTTKSIFEKFTDKIKTFLENAE